jgi:hypothetical protein
MRARALVAGGLLAGVIGLSVAPPATSPPATRSWRSRRSGGPPVAAIAAHGLIAVATLLLVLLAAIGA